MNVVRRFMATLVAAMLVFSFLHVAPASADRGSEWPLDRPVTFCFVQSDGTEVLTTATFGEGGDNGWWYTTTTGPEYIGGHHDPPCAPPTPADSDNDGIPDDQDTCDAVRGVTDGCAPTDPGPQPPDYIDYGPWGNQVPSCDVPVVTQSRMVATTPYVLNEDGSDWILGGTVLTTETQEVSLSDEELAACPTGSDPGPRPDDVVKVESYEGDASCESGTVEVITVTKTTTYYLGDDNKYYLSDRPSTDREVSSRDMTTDERAACAPDSQPIEKPIPPGPAPLVNAGSLTTAFPNTGSGNSTHHSVAAAVLLLEGIGGVVALILAVAVYSYDNRRRPWSH